MTTGGTAPRSARPGGGWSAGSTPPWPRSGCPGCGTPRRWSRSRATRSSPDHGQGVRAGRPGEPLAQRGERRGRLEAVPAAGQQLFGQAGIEEREPPPGGQRADVVGERLAACPVGTTGAVPAGDDLPGLVQERGVEDLKPSQVRPQSDLPYDITERQVVGAEDANVAGQL